MKLHFAALFLSLVIIVSGCVSSQTPQPGPEERPRPEDQPKARQFTVVISHTAYSPSRFEVNKGDTVTFLLVSAKGTGPESGFSHNHGITIDEYNINVAAASENTPAPVSFVADKAGTFSIYCRTCWDGPFGREHPDIRAALVVK